jgi:hypothetical protein
MRPDNTVGFGFMHPVMLEFSKRKCWYYNLHSFGFYLVRILFTLNYMFRQTCGHF